MVESEARWREALYGPSGFFTRGEVPADHFRTAPLVGPELAEALLVLLDRVDLALGRPARLDFVDVGAGGGELSAAVRSLAPGPLASRLVVTAVDVGPARSLPGVRWTSSLPASVCGLLVGHEWLDAVPCPLVVGPCDDPWLARWWPVRDGERAEIGRPRDVAWADAVSRVRGAALAVDYGHVLADRAAGRYAAGTFAAYRDGRRVPPVFDGSCDLTAHVALDACAEAAGGDWVLVSQRDALAALGLVGRSAPPTPTTAATDGTPSAPGTPDTRGPAATPTTPGTVDTLDTAATSGTAGTAATAGTPGTAITAATSSTAGTPHTVGAPGTAATSGTPSAPPAARAPATTGTAANRRAAAEPTTAGRPGGRSAGGGSAAALSGGTEAGLAWLAAAERASRVAELRAEGGLGSFGWLLHGVGVPVSALLPPLPPWRP